MRSSRLVVLVAVMLVAVGAVGSGVVLPAPAVAQAPATSGICDSEGVAQFSDVADSDYAAAYILCMRALGLSQGRSDGDFGPDRELNRGQMASFLIRLVDRPTRSAVSHRCGGPVHRYRRYYS